MDPNACRATIIEKANLMLGLASAQDVGVTAHTDLLALGVDLAEAVHDLDEWLRAGGFLPDAWVTDLGAKIFGSQPGRKQDVG